MTAPLVTLNVGPAQIEHELRAGKTVDEVSTEWQEPRGNVLHVLRAMQARGDNPAAPSPPDLAVSRIPPRDAAQVRPDIRERTTNAVELLARAKGIDDRRIQAALGRARKALSGLSALIADYEENVHKRARIAELEAELRALRGRSSDNALAGPARETGSRMAGEFPCTKCGRICTTAAGRGSHERHCTGGAS